MPCNITEIARHASITKSVALLKEPFPKLGKRFESLEVFIARDLSPREGSSRCDKPNLDATMNQVQGTTTYQNLPLKGRSVIQRFVDGSNT